MFKAASLLLLAFTFSAPALANSDAIKLRNQYSSWMDEYRNYTDRENKCGALAGARQNAQWLMEDHADATLAKQWNATLRSSGCRLTRLIVDSSATNKSSNPSVNPSADVAVASPAPVPLSDGGCLSWWNIDTSTNIVDKRCSDGGSIYIRINR